MTTSELPALDPATALRSDRLRRLWKELREEPLIDVYHGEMRFHMHPRVQQALLDTTRKLLTEDADLLESDGRPFDKAQPRILRELAADRLYARWRQAGLAVSADDVLVGPYSSLFMLEAVMASVARPDGVILCPEGFYKSARQHIEKFGLSIRLIPAPPEHDGKISPWQLRRAIQAHREQLCALLLTMPGNPLIATYTEDQPPGHRPGGHRGGRARHHRRDPRCRGRRLYAARGRNGRLRGNAPVSVRSDGHHRGAV